MTVVSRLTTNTYFKFEINAVLLSAIFAPTSGIPAITSFIYILFLQGLSYESAI